MSTGDQPVGVDSPALVNLANSMRDSAKTVKDQAATVAGATVGAADIGFAYKTQGDAIHAGLESVQTWLKDWSEATQLSGDAMGQMEIAVTTVDQVNSDNTQQAAS